MRGGEKAYRGVIVAAVVALVASFALASTAAAAGTARCEGKKATIKGTPGRDKLRATPGRDVIAALGGDDRIARANGNDLVCGGGGSDQIVIRPSPTSVPIKPPGGVDLLVPTFILGPGNDEVIIDCRAKGYPADAYIQIFGGAGDDSLDSNCPFFDYIDGGPGNDQIRLGAGHDIAIGGDGDDRIRDAYSRAGDCDAFDPAEWQSISRDRRCLPSIWGMDGLVPYEDMLFGGPGDDRVIGGWANDQLLGEDGDDVLSGGEGNDGFDGGLGNDSCDGEGGDADYTGQHAIPGLPCEVERNIEPYLRDDLAEPEAGRPNCSRALQPDDQDFLNCMARGPQFVMANDFGEPLTDVSSSAGTVRVDLMLFDGQQDPGEKLDHVTATFTSDEGYTRTYACSPEVATNGPIVVTYCKLRLSYPQGDLTTTWRATDITVFDKDGKYTSIDEARLYDPPWSNYEGTHYDFKHRVISVPDVAGPTVESVDIGPWEGEQPGGSYNSPIRIDVGVTDDVSGPQEVKLFVTRPSGTRVTEYGWKSSGSWMHGNYLVVPRIQNNSPPGEYEIELELEDWAGNLRTVTSADLDAMGEPSSFTLP